MCRQCEPPALAWEASRCGCRAAGQPEEASCKALCFNPHPQLLVWPDLHLEHQIQTKAMPLPLTCPFAFCLFVFTQSSHPHQRDSCPEDAQGLRLTQKWSESDFLLRFPAASTGLTNGLLASSSRRRDSER